MACPASGVAADLLPPWKAAFWRKEEGWASREDVVAWEGVAVVQEEKIHTVSEVRQEDEAVNRAHLPQGGEGGRSED